MSATQQIRNIGYRNPRTNRVLRSPKKIKELVEKREINLPDNILYNKISKRFILNIARNRNRFDGRKYAISENIIEHSTKYYMRKIVKDLKKLNFRGNKRYVIIFGEGYQKGYTITRDNVNEVIRKFKNEDALIHEEELPGSDVSIIMSMILDPKHYKIEEVDGIGRPQGGFFPYLVPFTGLERYGIYNKYDSDNYKDNCLVIALKSAGLNEDEVTNVKQFIKSGYVPQTKLKEVAEIIGYQIQLSDNSNLHLKKFNKESNKIIKLGLVEGHYFLIERTEFTKHYIENYEILKNIPEAKSWNSEHKNKKQKHLSSDRLIKLLIKNKHLLTKIDTLKGDTIYTTNYHERVHTPNNPEDYIVKYEKQKQFDKKKKIVGVFDFEASATNVGEHKPYLVSSIIDGKVKSNSGNECVKKLLSHVAKYSNKYTDVIMYAHNSRYDFGFIFNEPGVKVSGDPIKTGNGIKQVTIYYYGKKIIIKDSYSIIPEKLSKFGEMFDLEIEKEIMNHKLYTPENVEKRYINKNEVLKFYKEDEKEQFMKNCKKWNCIRGNDIDIIMYALEYCKMDCKVLKKGLEIFREQIKTVTDLDIYDIVSIPQLANTYLKNRGCFDDTYELTGATRGYIQQCVRGGRVMTRNNEKINIKERIQDFDGVSLYPSAMNRIKGMIRGKSYRINNLTKEFLDKVDYYYVTIKITKVNKHLNFPLIGITSENGSVEYVNKTCDVYYADKIHLEDLIKFQEIEYEIIEGIYFNEGFNPSLCDVMKELFEERKIKKKEKNPIQLVYKLIMNAAYGKMLLKPIDTQYKFSYDEKEFKKQLNYNYNQVIDFEKYGNVNVMKVSKSIVQSKNSVHQGVMILSMAKRIMNEVMCLAEDEKLDMYYTDTDSIHIKESHVDILANKFEEKYNRKLIGGNLGQFHCDFDNDAVSTHLIALGKKSYIDLLENPDGTISHHIRMKGVPKESILAKGDPMKTYQDLYEGKEKIFDLMAEKPKFDSSGFGVVKTLKSFTRTVKF